MEQKPGRIWELDALRGIAIWAVMALHLLFDLQAFFGLPLLEHPIMQIFNAAVGIFFVILSGLCVTLGSRPVRRGLVILCWAMAITAITWLMAKLGYMDPALVIRFGVLHLLGTAMLLWPLFRKLPTAVLLILGILLVALDFPFEQTTVTIPWLFPLGLMTETFSSGDYFPLVPHLGWFFLGAVIGRTAYKKRGTLLPRCSAQDPSTRFFCWCGRHSLLLYLAHQPILYGLITLFS